MPATTGACSRNGEPLGAELGMPLVAAGNVHMHCRERRMLQDTLTAIRLKIPLDKLGFELQPNARALLAAAAGARAPLSRRSCCARLSRYSSAWSSRSTELRYEYPHELVPEGETPASHLRRLTERGCRTGVGPRVSRPKVRKLIEHELRLIAELRYEAYLPHGARHRPLRPQHRDLVPGQGLGGQLRRVLLSRDHGGRS